MASSSTSPSTSTARPKRYRLPALLGQEEVAQLLDTAPTPFYRTILMTLHGTGVRPTELTRRKVSDIDRRPRIVRSRRKVVLGLEFSKGLLELADACHLCYWWRTQVCGGKSRYMSPERAMSINKTWKQGSACKSGYNRLFTLPCQDSISIADGDDLSVFDRDGLGHRTASLAVRIEPPVKILSAIFAGSC